MSITKIATVQTANAGNADASITVPSGVLPNHLGILAVATANSGAGLFPTPPPAPKGWTPRFNGINGSTGEMYLFTRLGGQSAGDTITVTQPSANGATTTAIWYDTGGRDIQYASAEWDTATNDLTTVTWLAPGQALSDGGYEHASSLDHYFAYYSATVAVDTTQHHSGTQSLKVSCTAGSGNPEGLIHFPPRPAGVLTNGGNVTCSAWFLGTSGQTFYIGGRTEDAQGNYVAERQGQVAFTATGSWQQVSTTAWYAPAGQSPGFEIVQQAAQSAAQTFWVDDASVLITTPTADVILSAASRTTTGNSLPAPTGVTLDLDQRDGGWLAGAWFGHANSVAPQSYTSTWTPSAATSHNIASMQFALSNTPTVFLRGTATAGDGATTNLNSLTITIPSTAKVGDVAVMTVGIVNNTATLTVSGNGQTNGGWTQVDYTTDASGTAASGWLFSKIVGPTDAGASFTLSFSATCHPTADLRVYANATLANAQLAKTAYGTTAATTFTVPSVSNVPAGGMVDVSIVARASSATAAVPAPTVSGGPGGYALATHASTAITTSPEGWSSALYRSAAQGGSYGGETLTTTQSSTAVAWTYALAPATGPTFVASYLDANEGTIAASHTASVTCAPGDVLLYFAFTGNSQTVPQTPTGGGMLWQKIVAGNTGTSGNAECTVWAATATTAQTFTLTGTTTGNLSGVSGGTWGFQVQRWANTAGLGTSQWGISGSTTGQISFTQTTANSALAMAISDYNSVATNTRSYVTSSAGAFTETYRANDPDYSVYCGFYGNDGVQGTKTVGIAAPTGTLDAIVVVELLPASTGGILAREGWAGSNGAAWPSQWITTTNNSGAATIQNNSGQLGFGTATGYNFGASAYLSPNLWVTDADVTATVTFQQIQEEYLYLALRSDGTRSAGYSLELQPGNGTSSLAICKHSSGATATQLGAGWVNGGQWTANVPRKVRFKVSGSTLSVKVWDASAAEPAAWTYSVTDTTYTGPGTFMAFVNTGNTTSGGTVQLDGLTITDTTVSVLYSETFPGASGAAWPSQWTMTNNTGAAPTQNGSGGGTLNTGSGTWIQGNSGVLTAVGTHSGFDVTYDVAMANADSYSNLWLRGDSTGAQSSYNFQYCPTDGGCRIVSETGGTVDNNSTPWSGAWWAATVRVRARAVGSLLQMKIWDATTAEPAAWTYTWTDTKYTSGYVALNLYTGNATGPVSDTISNLVVTDAGVTTQNYVAAPADNVGITGTTTAVQSNVRSAADNVGITDSVTATILHTGSGADNVGITDAKTVVQGLVRAPADNVGLTDSVTIVRQVFQTKADSVGITDTVTTAIIKTPTVPTDAVGITDAVTTAMSRVQTIADSIGIEDATAAAGRMFLPIVTTAAPDVESRSSLEDVVNLSATIGVTVDVATADLEVGPQRATFGIGAQGDLTRIISLSGAATGVISLDQSALRVVHKMTDIVSTETVGVIQQMTISNGPIYEVDRTNLVICPQPTTSNSPQWWSYANDGALAYSASDTGGPTGGGYIRWTVTTASSGGGGGGYFANVPVTAGQTYTASWYVRSSVAMTWNPTIEWHQADGSFSAVQSSTSGASVTLVPNTWTRVSVTGVPPSDATQCTPTNYAANFMTTVGATQDLTMALVETGSALLPFFDGSLAHTAYDNYWWSGAAENSSSTYQQYSAKGGWESGVYGPTRQRVWRMDRNEDCGVGWGAYVKADAFENIPAGSEVTVSVWFRVDTGVQQWDIAFQVCNSDSSDSPTTTDPNSGSGSSWPVVPTGDWQQFTETFTLSRDWLAGYHALRMDLPVTSGTDFLEWSDPLLTVTYIPSPPGPPTPPPPPPAPIVARTDTAQVGFALVAPEQMTVRKKMVKKISRIFSVLR